MARARPAAVLLTVLLVVGVPAPARALGSLAGPGVSVAVDAPAGAPGGMAVVVNPGGSATLTRTIATPTVPPHPDVVLLADVHDDTTADFGSVRANADMIMNQVRAVQPDAEFAAARYAGLEDGPYHIFHVDQDLTADQDLVRQGMTDWEAANDFDDKQDTLYALYQVANGAISWRPGSSRIVVLFSGLPAHDPSDGHSLDDTVAALVAQQIRVVIADVGKIEGGGDIALRKDQFARITDGTGGVLLSQRDPEKLPATMLQGIEALPETVRAVVGGCDPGITATVTPAQQTVASGAPADFTVTAQAASSVRDGDYACQIGFIVGNDDGNGMETLSVTVTGAVPDAPVLRTDATVVDFGAQQVGVPGAARTVTLTNGGDGPLTVSALLASSPVPPVFTVDSSGCAAVLREGAGCVLRIVATARAAGLASTSLTLTSTTPSGGTAIQPLTLRVTGRVPSVLLNPGVGRPGQVVAAVGRGFPPGAVVTIAWSVGPAPTTATADATGGFSVPVLVFSGVQAGPRTITATAPGLAAAATASFLADNGAWQPAGPERKDG